VDEVVDFCIRAEQRLLEPHELERLVEMRPTWADVVRFFKAHQDRLRQRSRIDYPTLLHDAAELIANHDDVREALHRRFMHVLVDDGQELARVQQRLLRFLTGFVDAPDAARGRSLVVAADPDSSIETFRGAEPDWFAGFEKDFGAQDGGPVVLTTSYRLGPDAGAAAVRFISQNEDADRRPTRFNGATLLEAYLFQNLAAEVEAVARELRLAHLRDGVLYEDMAILLTSPRSMLPALERALGAMEVPYSISAPDRPLEREAAVRSFTDLARIAFDKDPAPDQVIELLRSPLIGLEAQDVRELERAAREKNMDIFGYLASIKDGDGTDGRIKDMLDLRDLLRANEDAPADALFWLVWERAPYLKELVARARRDLADPANRDLDALVAFSRSLGRFVERRRGDATLKEYLKAIGRADFGSDPWLPPERRRGGVNVLSFHAAKGKEWDVVAVCGCVEGQIPKGRRAQGLFDPYSLDDLSAAERRARNDAEDRRVFYVATTRARQRCLVTTSPGPTRKGQPSRFVAELVGALPEVEQTADLPPLTFSEAAARARQVLGDPRRSAAERLAALLVVARICALDPSCSAANPSEWWWRWDWTEGALPINEQRAESDSEVPKDKLRTSYSRIGEYQKCGLKYLLGVVLGLDPETSHNMAFGTWIHKIFEEIEQHEIVNEEQMWARYEELFDDSFFPKQAIARQFRQDGRMMLDRYVRFLEPGRALLAERKFRVDLDGHVITGRIDRVDKKGNGVLVSDYKTSRHEMGWNDVKKSLQLAIYYLAAKADPEIAQHGEPVGMQLVYPAKLYRNNKVSVRCQTPEQAQEVIAELPALLDSVLAEDFRPNPEADCMFCKFKPLCPLWAEGKELPA